jgi:hypothetical protein
MQNSCDTVYPRNMVCFRYVGANTLHIGNDNDDNNNNHNHIFILILIPVAFGVAELTA